MSKEREALMVISYYEYKGENERCIERIKIFDGHTTLKDVWDYLPDGVADFECKKEE